MMHVLRFLLLFAVWSMLTWSLGRDSVIAGVLVSAAAVVVTAGITAVRPFRPRYPEMDRMLRAAKLCAFFLGDAIYGGLIAMYRVLVPGDPPAGAVTEIKMRLSSGPGRMLLALMTSAVPNALVVDADERNGRFSVYTPTERDRATVQKIVEKYQETIAGITGARG